MSDQQPSGQARLELAITRLSGSMDAAMARIEGRLELLVQRAEHSDQRADGQDAKIERLDRRADQLEVTRVTRAELDERFKRTLQVVAILVTLLGSATSAGTAILIAVIGN